MRNDGTAGVRGWEHKAAVCLQRVTAGVGAPGGSAGRWEYEAAATRGLQAYNLQRGTAGVGASGGGAGRREFEVATQ